MNQTTRKKETATEAGASYLCCDEKGRNERFVCMLYRFDVHDIEIGAGFDRIPNKVKRNTRDRLWDFEPLFLNMFYQFVGLESTSTTGGQRASNLENE